MLSVPVTTALFFAFEAAEDSIVSFTAHTDSKCKLKFWGREKKMEKISADLEASHMCPADYAVGTALKVNPVRAGRTGEHVPRTKSFPPLATSGTECQQDCSYSDQI